MVRAYSKYHFEEVGSYCSRAPFSRMTVDSITIFQVQNGKVRVTARKQIIPKLSEHFNKKQ
jgi:hypothetical protein